MPHNRISTLDERIHVVVLTFNNKDLLVSCLSSVHRAIKYAGVEGSITVVDNNSRDGTEEAVASLFPSVRYLRNPENYGTARGFNRGIRTGMGATYTMLMNDDVELFRETIASMIILLKRHPEAGGVPAHPVYPDGRSQRVKIKVLGGLKRIRDDKLRTAEFCGTTACLYRTEVFEKVGFFDEFFFFYNEDLDFSIRAKRAGVRFIFNPAIRVKHYLNQGRSKGERALRPHLHAANYYFYRKHYGRAAAFLYFVAAWLRIKGALKKLEGSDPGRHEMARQGLEKLKHTARHFYEILHGPRSSG